ncbi:MBL fold metallo-hydrolase [Oscillatoriales cyanobacterium LEGE 11467]|uniref:Metallo-beta-lactamase domain-containing protein 1 n=2 Tax=Zarconia TaxID=2992130 RepID=A0A928Z5Q0_9CYAN|nr:MBL fold metallo-hydrolase [Zarconia navalis LEGE 11467]
MFLLAPGQAQSSIRNQVRILLEGYVTPIEGREFVPGVRDDGARQVASTMALVEGDNAIVFVDPGFVRDRALIFDALAQAAVTPEAVTHVFISHHHPDHTLNAALFPNATVVDFWANYKGDLWEDRGDNVEIAPGIRVLRTPGHTREDASLVVETEKGTVVFTHVWWTEELFPPEDPLAEDAAALEASRQLVFSLADCIVPGHGGAFPNPQKPGANCDAIAFPQM